MNPSLSWFAWTGNKIKQGDDVKCHELCSDYNFYWTYFPCVYIYSHLSKNTIRFWIETCQNNLNLHCYAVRVMGNSVSQLFTGLIWWVGCFYCKLKKNINHLWSLVLCFEGHGRKNFNKTTCTFTSAPGSEMITKCLTLVILTPALISILKTKSLCSY